MNFRKITEEELADFAANVLLLLAGPDLPAIESHARAEFVTALGTLPALLAAETATAKVSEGLRKADISTRNKTRFKIRVLMAQIRDALKAGLADKQQYDKCGFDFPAAPVGTYTAQNPSNFSVVGFSDGTNRGRFLGNNKRGTVMYEIWRRQGDDGPWAFLLSTRRQAFKDSPVTPGQFYEYKVRAVAAKNMSDFSNSAVVYGAL